MMPEEANPWKGVGGAIDSVFPLLTGKEQARIASDYWRGVVGCVKDLVERRDRDIEARAKQLKFERLVWRRQKRRLVAAVAVGWLLAVAAWLPWKELV